MTDNRFEKFDIGNFKNNAIRGTYIIKSENSTVRQDEQLPGYLQELYLNNNPFVLNKFFYSNGNIEKKGYMFNDGSQTGIWYHFDETGKLIKEENTDEGYDFRPEDVVKYCESHKINLPKGYQNSGYQTSVQKRELDGKKVWAISYAISVGKQSFIEEIILDGKTGKLIDKKQNSYINN